MNKRDLIIAFLLGFVGVFTAVFFSVFTYQIKQVNQSQKKLEQTRNMVRIELQMLREKSTAVVSPDAAGPVTPGRAYSVLSELAASSRVLLTEVSIETKKDEATREVPPIRLNLTGDFSSILRFWQLLREQPGYRLNHGTLRANSESGKHGINATLLFSFSPAEEVKP